MIKSSTHTIKGMQRDLTVSKFSSEFVFEAHNIRITARDNNTLLSITNERGNKEMKLKDASNSEVTIQGVVIGYNVTNNYLTLFTTDSSTNPTTDRIYRINKGTGGSFKCITLYSGSLKFSAIHPIESIGIYENDNIQKVYWIDGLNQARVINIVAPDSVKSKWSDNSFDFVQTIKLNESITVTKNSSSNGFFAPGVIQYAFSYYNMYVQESNIFYTTPLQYISYIDRGASPEDKVNNSFTITIKNADTNFDYIRVYSIHRTSEDATPTVTNIVDLPIGTGDTLVYVDTGTTGSIIDNTELLYIGGESIVPSTMTQKDNTLFLGNIRLNKLNIDETIIDYFRGKPIAFLTQPRGAEYPAPNGYYPYNNQLKLESNKIKTFKYLEWYRFGIQFQHYTGKWSDPVWINDVQNTEHINVNFYDGETPYQPVARFILDNPGIITYLTFFGYVRVRPVIVYPSIIDREVICQGVLCPTVYNVSDRYNNSPFAQSSWFTRPNAPFDEYKAFNYLQDDNGEWVGDWLKFGENIGIYSEYSRAGVMSNDPVTMQVNSIRAITIESISKGAWAEFRHNYPIPSNNNRNAEIQCIYNPPSTPYIQDSLEEGEVMDWVSENTENFYIDQSIITLHSPDIEFDDSIKNIDMSSLKLRIVGIVPVTSFSSDIDISTSTPVNNYNDSDTVDIPIGFYKENIGVKNEFYSDSMPKVYGDSHFGWRGLISGLFWFDEATEGNTKNPNHYDTGFAVYPWHRNGSLNNTKFADDTGYRSAMLKTKKMSNLRYSYKTQYIDSDKIWKTSISGAQVFDSDVVSLIKLPAPKNSKLDSISYYGNIDKVIVPSRNGEKKDGYPIMCSLRVEEHSSSNVFRKEYKQITGTKQNTGIDPISMRYKSTPHAVMALNYTALGEQIVLPTITDSNGYSSWNVNNVTIGYTNMSPFWDKTKTAKAVYQDIIDIGITGDVADMGGIQYGWLWLGELYNDNVENRFGGQTDEAFENNIWLPCGNPVALTDGKNIKDSVVITWTEGDTYYQRYDHIKTYPFTFEDQNQVTDIISFMCETKVNIDGRYDKNRGQLSNLTVSPANFNLINKVYSQENNFFRYRTLNYNKYNIDYFPNIITWTKEKQAGAIIDTWTNITMASTCDLDGNKGEIISLNTFNNEIICFQRQGLSNIIFNSRIQIPVSDGVPIEITNGYKVEGKRYISNTIGCSNKWSITETPSGIYFIDNNTNGIYLFNGQINSLSDKLGFRQWVSSNKYTMDWDPVSFSNFVTYYDKNNSDVYFVNEETALVYSELLGQFTSFMSYGRVPAMFNINNAFYAIQYNKLWEQFVGDYNIFFDEPQTYDITFISNADEPYDKIFNTIEFRADCWTKDNYGNEILASNSTFDTLEVWNEYQKGISNLTSLTAKPSPLKKKFRVWRANIPRANVDWNGVKANNMDRIRNTWAYIKLSMNDKSNTDRMEFHDMIVHYFV